MSCGLIIWGKPRGSKKIFNIQKKTFRIVAVVGGGGGGLCCIKLFLQFIKIPIASEFLGGLF
jgi:hypothetical protein